MKHTTELVELKSGAKGLLIDVPDATVMYFGFNFRAGDYLSPEGKWDTAHAMEHILLGANERFKKSTEFSKEFCKNGAYNNASTGNYHMDYFSECADFEADRILDLTCLAIESPLFLNSEFKSEIANIRDELKMRRNNHFSELSLKMGEQLGVMDLPYSKRTRQLKNVTLKDVINHYQNTHNSSNMRFIIAGQVSKRRSEIVKRLESMKLKKGKDRIELPNEQINTIDKPVVINDSAVKNVYYRWETAVDCILNRKQEDAQSALFDSLLNTLHSRIFGRARERGLVYSIGFGRYNTRNNSLWWIGGQVMPKNITPLFELYKRELTSIARGKFSDEEMEDTRQYALGSFQRSVQTVSQLASGYETKFFQKDEVDIYSEIPKRIKAIKTNDIIEVARTCLDKNNHWALGFYGSLKRIDPDSLKSILANTYI